MNREDIIRMAREAGLLGKPTYIHGLEAFADLVATAERDRMCEQFNIPKELAHEKAKGNETN